MTAALARAARRAADRALCRVTGAHHHRVDRDDAHGLLYRQCTGLCGQRTYIPAEQEARATGSRY